MARPPVTGSAGDLLLRFLATAAAVALLWARYRYEIGLVEPGDEDGFITDGEFLVSLGLGLAAGILSGLAVRPAPIGLRGYRWGVALAAGLVPLAFVIAYYLDARGLWSAFDLGVSLYELTINHHTVFVLLTGVAITAGLAGRTLDEA
ncbi:MAG TPA: hypothetical protein VGB51_09035 [Actinomycetota bacterium]